MASVTGIWINQKDKSRLPAESCSLLQNHGIQGDAMAGPGERQISMALRDATRDGGLCGPRYGANLVVEGLCFQALSQGDLLWIGTAALKVSQVGKRCFPECPIAGGGGVCFLKTHCAFLTVEQDGEIRRGDAIRLDTPRSVSY
jgi:MOSC domain-containing protein YiiM